MEAKKVTMTFHRKWQLTGSAVRLLMFVNGEQVGEVRNGGELTVQVPRAERYLISVFSVMCGVITVLVPQGEQRGFDIWMKRGAPKRSARKDPRHDERSDKYSFALGDPGQGEFRQVRMNWRGETPDTPDGVMSLCEDYWCAVTDGFDELLYMENLPDIVTALRAIGAEKNGRIVEDVIADFAGQWKIPLPEGAEGKALDEKLHRANECFDRSVDELDAEMEKAITAYILAHEEWYMD